MYAVQQQAALAAVPYQQCQGFAMQAAARRHQMRAYRLARAQQLRTEMPAKRERTRRWLIAQRELRERSSSPQHTNTSPLLLASHQSTYAR